MRGKTFAFRGLSGFEVASLDKLLLANFTPKAMGTKTTNAAKHLKALFITITFTTIARANFVCPIKFFAVRITIP